MGVKTKKNPLFGHDNKVFIRWIAAVLIVPAEISRQYPSKCQPKCQPLICSLVPTAMVPPPVNKATVVATNRLKQDYMRLKTDPVPYVTAEPLPSNIFEWHYILEGPENSPYEGGYYHGKIIFPINFPFEPPSIYMITPNGRFATDTKLCLSITDYHPESWNPAWTISTILTGLLSFMLENTPTGGGTDSSNKTKLQMAAESLEFNIKNKIFCELFPEFVEEIHQVLKVRKDFKLQASAANNPDNPSSTSSNSNTPNDETGPDSK